MKKYTLGNWYHTDTDKVAVDIFYTWDAIDWHLAITIYDTNVPDLKKMAEKILQILPLDKPKET